MSERFSWGSTELIPTDKAGRDAMASRAMADFIRSTPSRKGKAPSKKPEEAEARG